MRVCSSLLICLFVCFFAFFVCVSLLSPTVALLLSVVLGRPTPLQHPLLKRNPHYVRGDWRCCGDVGSSGRTCLEVLPFAWVCKCVCECVSSWEKEHIQCLLDQGWQLFYPVLYLLDSICRRLFVCAPVQPWPLYAPMVWKCISIICSSVCWLNLSPYECSNNISWKCSLRNFA